MSNGKKKTVSWKAKYQQRSQEIADVKRERDRAIAERDEMGRELAQAQGLFNSLKESFGTDALTVWNTYTRKMKELDEREQAIGQREKESAEGIEERERDAQSQVSDMLHNAGNTAQTTIATAENDADDLREKAQMLVDEAQAAIDAGVEAKSQHLNELKAELEKYDAALDHRSKDLDQREEEAIAYEKETDKRLLEAKRLEQYIEDTMGDAPIKKMRKRLHERGQEVTKANRKAGEAKAKAKTLSTENRKLQLVVGMAQQQAGKQRDTIARQAQYIGDLREEKGLDRTISIEELFYATATPEEIEAYNEQKAEAEKQQDETMMNIAKQHMAAQKKGKKDEERSLSVLEEMGLTVEDLEPYIQRHKEEPKEESIVSPKVIQEQLKGGEFVSAEPTAAE